MKIIIILAVILASLHAESYFINVMTSKYKEQFSPISYQLELLGYQRYISRNTRYYILYAGPFSSLKQAQNAQANMSKNIGLKNTRIVQNAATKGEIIPQIVASSKKSKYFLGFNAGIIYINNTQDSAYGDITLDTDISDNGFTLGAELGYYLNENIFMTLNYNYCKLDTFSVNNLFFTYNYEFLKEDIFSPYIGMLGGYSLLHWDKYPIASINKDDSSSSFMGGLQMGFNIKIVENIQLYGLYQIWLMKHETEFENSQGKMNIEQNIAHNLGAGIKYRF